FQGVEKAARKSRKPIWYKGFRHVHAAVGSCERSAEGRRYYCSARVRPTMSLTSPERESVPATRRSALSARARRAGSSARQLRNAVIRRAATWGFLGSSASTVSARK